MKRKNKLQLKLTTQQIDPGVKKTLSLKGKNGSRKSAFTLETSEALLQSNVQIQPNQIDSVSILERWIIDVGAKTPKPPFTKDTSLTHKDFKLNSDKLSASGAFGTVWLCKHKEFPDLPLAMKIIPCKLNSNGPSGRELLEIKREIQINRLLEHQHIVAWYGSTVDLDNGVSILMEYVDGPTLDNAILLGGRFPMDISEYCLKSIIEALNYMKTEHKVAHRDIKPTNIMFNAKGILKLCDFGCSRIISTTQKSHASALVGAKSYMSPEMLNFDDRDDMDYYQSDVFSLSTTLLECLFGFYPYPLVEDQGLKNFLDANRPTTDRNKESSGGYITRDLSENTIFGIMTILDELQGSRFPDFILNDDEEVYFKKSYVDIIDRMTIKNPKERINYEQMFENEYFQSIKVYQSDIQAWVAQVLSFAE